MIITVNVVLAVNATVDPGPVPIKPFLEMTGPEKVVFAMIVLLVNST